MDHKKVCCCSSIKLGQVKWNEALTCVAGGIENVPSSYGQAYATLDAWFRISMR